MIKTFHYKLKPTKAQALVFDQWLNSCRFVYNLTLSHKIDVYRTHQKNLSKYDAQKQLTEVRNEYDWIGQVHSQTLQSVTDKLYLAYDKFFKGGGFPRFARKNFYSSFEFKQGVSPCVNTGKLKLPSIGKVKYHNSRPIEGKIKKAIIKKENNDWFISLACEMDKPTPTDKKKNDIIGIDVGIKDFAILSNGEKFDNPKYYRVYEQALVQAQRALSRKKKGSKNREKLRNELSKIHVKIKNTRKDFLHKLSSKLINENQVIVLEDLKVKNMVKNHCLSKSISDAGWSMFKNMLQYKADMYGGQLILVSPNNTSKCCSYCGWKKEDMTLSTREWVCEGCGVLHDRDVNAGKNILNRGLIALAEQGHCFDICGGTAANAVMSDMAQR